MILLSAGPPLALHAALSRWGVWVGEAVILDPLAAVFGADPTAPVITTYGAHESLKDFRLLSFFPWSRPLGATERPPAGTRVSPLVWSSPQSWARPYRTGVRPEQINRAFVAGTDQKGPLMLGVAVEARDARLIVLGTAEIAANQYFLLFGHKNLLSTAPGRLASTLPVVTEVCHVLNQKGKVAFLTWIRRGGLAVQPVEVDDFDEIVTIIARYGDHDMDFADATLVWLAELVNTLDVMTIDRRDFQTYRPRSGKAFNLVLS